MTFEPTTKGEEILHAETLQQFNYLIQVRRSRIANVTYGIPAVLWWVVAIGALLNIGIIWLFNMETHVHLLLGGAIALFMGVMIFLIASMITRFEARSALAPAPSN